MKLNIITLLFFSFCIGQNTELFDKGNDLYNQGRYLEAIESYSDIIKDGKHSSELYYNMGNSYYKLNDIANSIFYYEKALLLNPKSEKITNNLSFAQNMLIDKIEPLPQNQINSFFSSIINLFDYSIWQYIFLFFEFTAVIFLILYLISKTPLNKKRYFISALTLSLFFVLSLIAANISKNLRTEPNLRSEEINTLHEGTKLNIIEKIDDWSYIELKNGNKGWLTSSSYRLIR